MTLTPSLICCPNSAASCDLSRLTHTLSLPFRHVRQQPEGSLLYPTPFRGTVIYKKILPFLVLACSLLLGGCFPGTYISRDPANGVVVDAITNTPLSGVRIMYAGEEQVTEASGAFSFATHREFTIYTIPGENPRRHQMPSPVSFSKSGYVSQEREPNEKETVRLEPSRVPEGIAALDDSISAVYIAHDASGRVGRRIQLRLPARLGLSMQGQFMPGEYGWAGAGKVCARWTGQKRAMHNG